MTLEQAIEIKKGHTAQASSNVRALAFAGIGVVWILSQQKLEQLTRGLVSCLILFATALVLDFLHYAVASLVWEIFVARAEVRYKRDEQVHALKWFNWPTSFFFWAKQVAVAAGYWELLAALFRRLP